MSPGTQTFFTYNTPVGQITLASDGGAIVGLAFGGRTLEGEQRPTELTNLAANELQEYLAGKRRSFDIPLEPHGSPFQRDVWKAACSIPYGEARSYQEVAEALGSPHAGRAIGVACSKNPLPILVPCHRIVTAGGAPGGAAHEQKVRRFLLDLERGL